MQAYINEKTSPELLVFDAELVDRVTAQLTHQAQLLLAVNMSAQSLGGHSLSLPQEQRVNSLDKHADTALERCMYLTELDRVKFVLRSYYRTRLRKVDLCDGDTSSRSRGTSRGSVCRSRHM